MSAGQGLRPFYDWLGVTGSPLTALSEARREADRGVAQEVLAHFRQNRPAPSSLPAVSLQVLNAVADPEVGLRDLTRLIGTDPALAAGVLKVANSPGFVGAQEFTSLQEAVTRLGLSEVGRVAGIVAARSLFQPQVKSEFTRFGPRFTSLFTEAIVTARAAGQLALSVRGARADQVFLAGMLQDLGRAVALRSLAAAVAQPGRPAVPEDRLERVLEAVHVEVGGEVHAEWGLPRFATLVAMRHHDLGLPADGEFLDLHVVRLVAAVVQLRSQPWRLETLAPELEESAGVLKLDVFGLRSLATRIKEETAVVGQLYAAGPRRKVG